MAICENCGKTYDFCDGVDNPLKNFCSRKCEDEFYRKQLGKFCQIEERVDHPSIYNKGGIEVWDVEKAFATTKWHPFIEHLRFGAVEYLLRAPDKNGVDDIRKARFLLDMIVKEMEEK